MKLSQMKNKGFSLLEVLIAFAIIMISIVSLVSLHRFYIRSEINASVLNGAVILAQSKLDDLRTFDSVAASGSIVAYENIGTDEGGTITDPQTIGSYKYNLTWSVSNSDLTAVASAADLAELDIFPLKNVRVTVSWEGTENKSNSVSLYSSISSNISVDSEQIINTAVASGDSPKIPYTPGLAPDVISIDLGNDSQQETTKPLPEVSNSGGSVVVQFSTITYDTLSNTQVLSDTSSLSCSCKFLSGSNIPKTALPAKPTLIDGLLYWRSEGQDNYVSKSAGESNSNQQSKLCDICCESHFDFTGTLPADPAVYTDFDRYYNKLNFPSAKYNVTNSNTLTAVTSSAYVDSCRLMLIDGYYKPMPDWNLVKLVVASSDFFSDPDKQALYQVYVKYVVKTYVQLLKDNSWSNTSSTSSANATLIPGSANGIDDFSTWLGKYNYSTNVDFTAEKDSSGSVQLISRGIFVDLMSNEWLDTLDTSTSDFYAKVPFYDVNMTLLSQWSSDTPDYVSSKPIQTLSNSTSNYYGTYSRGLVSAIPSSGSLTVTAKAFQGNSAVASYQVGNGKSKTEIPVTEYDSNNQLSTTLTLSGSSESAVVGDLYCFDSTTDLSGLTDCDTSLLANMTIRSLSTAVDCELGDVNTFGSSPYRHFKCTPVNTLSSGNEVSFGISIENIPTSHIVYPSTINTTITANSLNNIGCVSAYPKTLIVGTGIFFDSENCLTSAPTTTP